MIELIREEDFYELPEEPEHRWIQLEKIARQRLSNFLRDPHTDVSNEVLKNQYMAVVNELAQTSDVKGIAISSATDVDVRLDTFQLAVSRAKTRIWSSSQASYPLGRVALGKEAKETILSLTSEIELKIDSLDSEDKRKRALHQMLEDFRREINQPKTRIGTALTTLAQLSTVTAMTITSLAQGPDAFAAIQKILGAEQLEASSSELKLIGNEKTLLLPSPQKQITGPS